MTIHKTLQSLLAKWLSENSQGVFWLLVLFTIQLIAGRFYEATGYWDTSSSIAPAAEIFQKYFQSVLIALIGLSMLFKNNTFDLKLLIVLLLVPSNITFQYVTFPMLEAIVALSRWQSLLKKIAALLIMVFSINHHVWLLSLSSICCLETYIKPDDHYLASTTDNIYNFYKYTEHYSAHGTPYALFRVLNIAPGIRLVKRIDQCDAKGQVQVTRSKNGKYKIEGKDLTRNE